RSDMARLRRDEKGISRGSFNRTLRQARENVVEAIHTVLRLGYSGLTESPSIAPFLEASERLKSQTSQLRDAAQNEPEVYRRTVDSIIDDLEQAFRAMFGRNRDMSHHVSDYVSRISRSSCVLEPPGDYSLCRAWVWRVLSCV